MLPGGGLEGELGAQAVLHRDMEGLIAGLGIWGPSVD